MKLRPGTIMIAVPAEGASKDKCIICTGPKHHSGCDHDHVGDAFIVGMVEGMLAMMTMRAHLPGGRVPLCIEHETRLREVLALHVQEHPEILDKLGIEYKVA